MGQDFEEKLTEEEYEVLRNKGTEPRGSGKYLKFEEDGYYHCKACGNKIFDSEDKFNSNSGWPSFNDVLDGSIKLEEDNRHGMTRTEVKCGKCNSHLGHVFDDGPKPTGKRYCINSVALDFEE